MAKQEFKKITVQDIERAQKLLKDCDVARERSFAFTREEIEKISLDLGIKVDISRKTINGMPFVYIDPIALS